MRTPLYNPYAYRHCCIYARQYGGSLSLGFLLANFQVFLFLYKPKLCTYHYPPQGSPLSKLKTLPRREKKKKKRLDKNVYTVGSAMTNPPSVYVLSRSLPSAMVSIWKSRAAFIANFWCLNSLLAYAQKTTLFSILLKTHSTCLTWSEINIIPVQLKGDTFSIFTLVHKRRENKKKKGLESELE